MLTKRIIPCLDVKNGYVVKGIKFKNHEIVGSILDLASKYNEEGADELVFYDIGANIGFYSLLASKFMRSKTYSFEPDLMNARSVSYTHLTLPTKRIV